ncbi:hypothetical protein [Sporolactobacillus pectinivorans]|uniref:hypothetical protein n=1 Tax=Sporolactobacillus pectinivorans TaxID=1591408 RepID=UPI000C261953|nr:hypothetical protein [Sporolactobacillus pectinivorans]
MDESLLKQILDKLNTIDERTKKLDNNQKQFEDHFEQIDKKLNTITEQIVKNSEQITLLRESQAALISGQQKQDKILEMLAMRSLEQESDIRDLKRIK